MKTPAEFYAQELRAHKEKAPQQPYVELDGYGDCRGMNAAYVDDNGKVVITRWRGYKEYGVSGGDDEVQIYSRESAANLITFLKEVYAL